MVGTALEGAAPGFFVMLQYTRIFHAACRFFGPALAIVGCNSSPGHVQQSEFQSEIVHALCDSVQQCCTAAERGFDPNHCRQTVIQNFVNPLSDTTLIYDSAQAGRCIQAITDAAQACNTVDVTTCFDAFIGNIPPGSACTSSFDCAPGPGGFAVCGPNGLCAQPPRGGLGAVCSFTCVEGNGMPHCHNIFYNNASAEQAACHSSDGLVCVAAMNAPATCQPTAVDCKQNPESACPPGQLCDVNAGQCYLPVPVGGNCAAGMCSPDGWCANSICNPVKENAAICVNAIECRSGKCDRGFCVEYSKAAADWCGASTNE